MIKTKREYFSHLRKLSLVFLAQDGTPEAKEAKRLEKLIEKYEDKHFKFEKPTKQEADEYAKRMKGEK